MYYGKLISSIVNLAKEKEEPTMYLHVCRHSVMVVASIK